MSDTEQRFCLTMGGVDRNEPGLVRERDGSVWLVNADGTRSQVGISSGGLREDAQALVSESYDRVVAAWPAVPQSGQMHAVGIPLQEGEVVSQLVVGMKTPQAATTHAWLVLYSPGGALVALTADTPAAFKSGGPLVSVPLVSPYDVPTSGLYYGGFLLISSGTVPELIGAAVPAAGFLGVVGSGRLRAGQRTGLSAPPDPAGLVDGASQWTPWVAAR